MALLHGAELVSPVEELTTETLGRLLAEHEVTVMRRCRRRWWGHCRMGAFRRG